MEEALKNRLILILAILSAIFFIGTVSSCGTSKRLKLVLVELNKEKATNWDAEQKSNELKKEKINAEKELEEAKANLETNKKALFQEQLVNQSLKEELEKLTKLKEKLEEDLKEALVKSKK